MYSIQPVSLEHSPALCAFLQRQWGGNTVVSLGRVHKIDTLCGFAATQGDELLGLITYEVCDDACEIVTLDSVSEHRGIGTALLSTVSDYAKVQACKRLWLVTTNDNTHAIRFYQRRGFTMVALHLNAIEEYRRIKPQIPLIGFDNIPILHEIEFEKAL